MAVAAEERTRCALCGAWIERPPAWEADSREVPDWWQPHECDPGLAAYSSAEHEERARCRVSIDSVSRRRVRLSDLVGVQEIGERLGVKVETVWQWKYRGLLPAVEATISGTPIWEWQRIEAWAIETGRLSRPPASQ
jgi:hypothetical protein